MSGTHVSSRFCGGHFHLVATLLPGGSTTQTRRARSHIPLPMSPRRSQYQASAEATESEIRTRLCMLPFTRGAELVTLADELEKAYTQIICLEPGHDEHDEDNIKRIVRRRLRLIERPAPPAAGHLSSYCFGVSTCAVLASAVLWYRHAIEPERCPRCMDYFTACVPAFRLTVRASAVRVDTMRLSIYLYSCASDHRDG